jgi:hypothetical protein
VNVKGRTIARAEAAAYLPPVKLKQMVARLQMNCARMKLKENCRKRPFGLQPNLVQWTNILLERVVMRLRATGSKV